MEAASVSINGWMDKEDVLYVYSDILVSYKKEWDLAICDIGRTSIMLSEITQRKVNTMWFSLHVESKRLNY